MNFSLLLRNLSLVYLSVWNVDIKMEMIHIFNWMGSTDTELRRKEISELLFWCAFN